ncbi:MAG: response regulator [Desulfobacterales bacterium]|nr:response regulator [Desulfobacterales bacterium]MCP4160726.1 response regulator [Deltaproteobacteria bacterium]
MDNDSISVLLIEDNPVDIEIIKTMLKKAIDIDFILKCSNNLSDGLKSLIQNNIDVILLDLSLPDSDGIETFAKIKAHTPHIPVIVLTGHMDDKAIAMKALRAGAQDYLLKGQINKTMIVRSLRYAIERKRAEEFIHALTQKFIRLQENERSKIARKLHENVAQDLSSIRLFCENLFSDDIKNDKIKKVSSMLYNVIKNIREISYDLYPATLKELGLIPTIKIMCSDFSEKRNISTQIHTAGVENLKFSYEKEINIYRIIQEAFKNITTHSCATNVTLRIVGASPNIIFRIDDDGIGFKVTEELIDNLSEERTGLRNIEERVKMMGGKSRIKSTPHAGTNIYFEIPVK